MNIRTWIIIALILIVLAVTGTTILYFRLLPAILSQLIGSITLAVNSLCCVALIIGGGLTLWLVRRRTIVTIYNANIVDGKIVK